MSTFGIITTAHIVSDIQLRYLERFIRDLDQLYGEKTIHIGVSFSTDIYKIKFVDLLATLTYEHTIIYFLKKPISKTAYLLDRYMFTEKHVYLLMLDIDDYLTDNTLEKIDSLLEHLKYKDYPDLILLNKSFVKHIKPVLASATIDPVLDYNKSKNYIPPECFVMKTSHIHALRYNDFRMIKDKLTDKSKLDHVLNYFYLTKRSTLKFAVLADDCDCYIRNDDNPEKWIDLDSIENIIKPLFPAYERKHLYDIYPSSGIFEQGKLIKEGIGSSHSHICVFVSSHISYDCQLLYLERCLSSLLIQTHHADVCVSISLLTSYLEDFKQLVTKFPTVIFNVEEKQTSQLRHIKQLTDKYSKNYSLILFCDDDDYYEKNRIEMFADTYKFHHMSYDTFGENSALNEHNYEYWNFGIKPTILQDFFRRHLGHEQYLDLRFADILLGAYFKRYKLLGLDEIIARDYSYHYNYENINSITFNYRYCGNFLIDYELTQQMLYSIVDNRINYLDELNKKYNKYKSIDFSEYKRYKRLYKKLQFFAYEVLFVNLKK